MDFKNRHTTACLKMDEREHRKRKRSADLITRKRVCHGDGIWDKLIADAESSAEDDEGRLWAAEAHFQFMKGLNAPDVTVQQWSAFALGNMLADHVPDDETAVLCSLSLLKALVKTTDAVFGEICAFALFNGVRCGRLSDATKFSIVIVAGDWLVCWVAEAESMTETIRDTVVHLLGSISWTVSTGDPPPTESLVQFAAVALRLATEGDWADDVVCLASLQVLVLVYGRAEPDATVAVPARDVRTIGTVMRLRDPAVFAEIQRTGRGTLTQVLIMKHGLIERALRLHEWLETCVETASTRELYASFLVGAIFDTTESTFMAFHSRGFLNLLIDLAKSKVTQEGSRRIVGAIVAQLLLFSEPTQRSVFMHLVQECGALVLVTQFIKELVEGAARPVAFELDSLLVFLHRALDLADHQQVQMASKNVGLETALGRIHTSRADAETVTLVGDILMKLDLADVDT